MNNSRNSLSCTHFSSPATVLSFLSWASLFSRKYKTGGSGWGGETWSVSNVLPPLNPLPRVPGPATSPRGLGGGGAPSPGLLCSTRTSRLALDAGGHGAVAHHAAPPTPAHSWRRVPALPPERRRRSGRGALWAEGRGLGRWRLPASSTGGEFPPSRGRSPAPGTDTGRWPSGS